ncbi:MAG: ShlB/FhaC/HecB family hemolysin secretion/activation protein [Pseudomonadota bacterium]
MGNVTFRRVLLCFVIAELILANLSTPVVYARDETVTFDIRIFDIKGNTLFPNEDLQKIVGPEIGSGKTADDVEAARDRLEKYFHNKGYPTVIVNIPEQSVEGGTVQLEVIESKIRRVRVTGNRYFTMEKILGDLPSVSAGRILYVPDVQKELAVLNRNPDLKVAPVLTPGKEVGTIDIELKVKDKLPLHASVEVNNRGTHNTTDLRVNGMISYDNLWQKEHSVSAQFQTSPQDTSEVQAITASYVMPAPWNKNQMFVMYGLWSDSETAFGSDFLTIGSGFIFGLRNIIPLPPLPSLDNFSHSLSLGIDYKDFDEDLSFKESEEEGMKTPISYAPVSLAYNAVRKDTTGYTQLNTGLNFLFRNLASDPDEFENKRYKARGNYVYATTGLERSQNLPAGFNLTAKVDGQLSNQPLISNEQYIAGGMASVRGYKESEAAGDNAVHTTVEFGRPFQLSNESAWGGIQITPYVFYDGAWLRIKNALDGQDDKLSLQGMGAGMRGSLSDKLDFEIDAASALSDTDEVKSGDKEFYFKVKAHF